MQAMIQEIVDIIQEDAKSLQYSLSSGEILELVADRMRGVAGRRDVSLETTGDCYATFTNREGNLVLLVLENLVRNAIEASSQGGRVVAQCERDGRGRVFLVRDNGPGLPDDVRRRLFQPVRSTKPGGSGIGLSISRHLARQLGANLELIRSNAAGTEFALVLPDSGNGSG
jgi:signal transduction histidine kinase